MPAPGIAACTVKADSILTDRAAQTRSEESLRPLSSFAWRGVLRTAAATRQARGAAALVA